VLAYLFRRFLWGILTLFLITFVVYSLIRKMPGDPVLMKIMGSTESTPIQKDQTARKYETMSKKLGLDRNFVLGYTQWISDVFSFDLGVSLVDGRRVTERIKERLFPTLWLSVTSLILIYLLSIPMGLYATAANRKPSERILSTSLYILYSIPSFVMALLVMVYIIKPWIHPYFDESFPISGMISDDYKKMTPWEQHWDFLKHLLLPVFCYTYGGLAYYTRFIRSNMMEVVRQDYIRTARAKGLSEPVILIRHGFRNTLIPLVTLLGLSLPSLVSGSIILENVFSWPGMGKEYFESINQRDYPMIMGITLMFSVLIMVGNLLADILYAVVDPRVTYH
jgi:peptide/nickel transport system permease protein